MRCTECCNEDGVDNAHNGNGSLDADNARGSVFGLCFLCGGVEGCVPEAGCCNARQEGGDVTSGCVGCQQHHGEADDVGNSACDGELLTSDAVGELAANPYA